MSAQERRKGEREGRKKAQTVASLVEPGRRSCIVDQGGRADCGHGAAVSVKFSRPTLNGPFATPCLSSPPAGDSLGLHAFCFPRRPLEKKTGLNEFDIRHSRDGHSSESRQLFPRPRTRDSIRFDETEIPGSIVLHRGFLFLQFAFFSSSLFINPVHVTAKRRIENFHFFRCRAHTFGAANGTKKRLE